MRFITRKCPFNWFNDKTYQIHEINCDINKIIGKQIRTAYVIEYSLRNINGPPNINSKDILQ